MGRSRLTKNIEIDFPDDSPEWARIRKTPQMVSFLDTLGEETVAKCNTELHAAQAKRKQPVEDGYEHRVSEVGDRARLYIVASTARGMAHEAVNQAILKNITVGEVKNRKPPNPEIPRELGRRSDAARNLDAQGNRIHGLDT